MLGNTTLAALMLDYSVYLQQWIGVTLIRKNHLCQIPWLNPCPGQQAHMVMTWAELFFIVVTDFSQSPGFICNFSCTGTVLLLSFCILPRSSVESHTSLLSLTKPCQYLQLIQNDLPWMRLSLLKNKHGLPAFIYMLKKKKERKQPSTEDNSVDTEAHGIMPVRL